MEANSNKMGHLKIQIILYSNKMFLSFLFKLTASIRTVSDRHSFTPHWCMVRVGPTQFYIECVASVSTEVEIDQQYTTMIRRAAIPIKQIKCSKIVHEQVSYHSFNKHYLGWNVCDGKAKIYLFCSYFAKFVICSLEID